MGDMVGCGCEERETKKKSRLPQRFMSVWGESEKGLVISCFDGKDAKRVDDFFFRLVSMSCSPREISQVNG